MKKEVKQSALDTDEAGGEGEITTTVDNLLDLLASEDKMALSDAAKKLNVDLSVVQSWVDFLVEEQLVGIEYKFTKPYIYLNKTEQKEEVPVTEEHISFEGIKREFYVKAQANNIPLQNITALWRKHLVSALAAKETFFREEATKRSLQGVDKLWHDYKKQFIMNHES